MKLPPNTTTRTQVYLVHDPLDPFGDCHEVQMKDIQKGSFFRLIDPDSFAFSVDEMYARDDGNHVYRAWSSAGEAVLTPLIDGTSENRHVVVVTLAFLYAGNDVYVCNHVDNPLGKASIERLRQEYVEGFSPTHDDAHTDGSIADAAACYLSPSRLLIEQHGQPGHVAGRQAWPWGTNMDKRAARPFRPATSKGVKQRLREIEKGMALASAEYSRLQRFLKTVEDLEDPQQVLDKVH